MEQPLPNAESNKLTEQLVKYADAITAFSFVQSVTFGFALGQKDFRESVLKGPWIVMLILIGAYAIYWKFVRRCEQGVSALSPEPKEANPANVEIPKWKRETWKYRKIVLALGLTLSLLGLTLTMIGDCLEKKNAPPKPEIRQTTVPAK
jgi:uncharacterized membrane protein